MLFSPAKFNQLLENIGQRVTWQKATKCPCFSESTGQPRIDCPYCHGKGFIFSATNTSVIGLSGQKVQQQWANFGEWTKGDVVVTIGSDQPAYACGPNDRVIFVQSSRPFSLTVKRGAERYPLGMCQADMLMWLDPDTNEMQTMPPPPVTPTGNLDWGDLEGPPEGIRYTINGRLRPVYRVFGEFPQDRAHCGGLSLPRRVVLQLYDLVTK